MSRRREGENLGDSEVMILRIHGLLSVRQTFGQAFSTSTVSRWPRQTQLLAMVCTRKYRSAARRYRSFERAARGVADAGRRGRKRPHGSMEWPALRRMLDRRDTSYKN